MLLKFFKYLSKVILFRATECVFALGSKRACLGMPAPRYATRYEGHTVLSTLSVKLIHR